MPKVSQHVASEDFLDNSLSQEVMASREAAEIDSNTSQNTDSTAFGQSSDQAGSDRNSIWDGGLSWELFNVQPSVEWFGAGYDSLFDELRLSHCDRKFDL